MEKLESLVFLAFCFGVPVLMAAILVWRLIAWLRDRRGSKRLLQEGGWREAASGDVAKALAGTGIAIGRNASLHRACTRNGVMIAHYRWRSRGGRAGQRMGRSRRLLLVPRESEGPLGVVQPRDGGMLESAALGIASIAGAEPKALPGWEWAIVSGPADWLPAEASPKVKALLRPGEQLHLGSTHAVLSLPDGPMAPLLEEAAARADAVSEAIA